MPLRFTVHLVPLVLAAATSFFLAYYAYRHRSKRTAPQVVGTLVGAGIWAGADALTLAATNPDAMVLFNNVRFLGSTLLVFSIVLFALEHTNREWWLQRRYVAALLAPFLVTIVLVWTDPYVYEHGLVRADVEVVESAGLVIAEYEFGFWFWVNAAYSYVLLLFALFFYVVELLRKTVATYRKQILSIIVALLVPWFGNGLYLADVTPVDLTGAGLVVTGALFYASLFWYSLLNLVPIARGTVFDHIEQGVLVLDTDDTVVDCNQRVCVFLDQSRDELVGASYERAVAAYPALRERDGGDRDAREVISVDREGTRRHYEVEFSPIYSRTDQYIGRTLLVRDVTDRVARERTLQERTEQLEHQNERLDEFARIVSHDLRNPLNVAQGYLDLAREQSDLEELEQVAASHDRMDELIDDVLTLARETQREGGTESVSLEAVAEHAWETVDPLDGTLVVDADPTIAADPSRLQQLFENLFRNAYDHGPVDATITVGELEDEAGFFVADDGPGIDPAGRDQIFEEGYTTDANGTGLGLAIVQAITEAHGWSVRVTESRSGGARFELADVVTGSSVTDDAPRTDRPGPVPEPADVGLDDER